MKYVSQAVGIEELLRIPWTARVANPDLELAALAKKHSAFRPQQQDCQQQDQRSQQKWPELAAVNHH